MRPFGSPTELEHRRKLVVHRVVKDGYSIREASEFFGIDPSSVRRWVAAFEHDGEAGLAAHEASGRPQKLTYFQEKIVARWINESPTVFGFRSELWTSNRLCILMRREFGIHFNSNYFVEWLRARHFTPQKPQRVPRERDPKYIKHWLKHDWPRIKEKAARNKAYLALIDESGLFFKTLINDYFDSFFMAAFLEAILRSIRGSIVVVWDRGRNQQEELDAEEARRPYRPATFLPSLPPMKGWNSSGGGHTYDGF